MAYQGFLVGELVSLFWWVELDFFSLECNEVSSIEFWDVNGFGVTLSSLYIEAQGYVPVFMGFSRQEYWRGLPCPLIGDLPNPGIKPRSPTSQADFYCLSHQGRLYLIRISYCSSIRVIFFQVSFLWMAHLWLNNLFLPVDKLPFV